MKSSILVYVSFLIFTLTHSHVTNREKEIETTTKFSYNENSDKSDLKEVTEKIHELNKAKNNKSYVYLEDVLFSLRNQNWTFEEESCLNHTLVLIHSLQNFSLWAVWDWDSIASEPLGLLYGNRYQLGNFDECLNTPWADTHPELKTQYCLSEIVLERTDNPVKKRDKNYEGIYKPYGSALDYLMHHSPHTRPLNVLTWGVCVPAECSPRSVERLLSTMLARSHLAAAGIRPNISIKEQCQLSVKPLEFDGLFYAFIIIFGILLVTSLVCTYINNRKSDVSNYKTHDVIKAFCLKENAKDLLKMKKEGAEILYGIRFLTICFIVMDHQVGIQSSGPVSNGLEIDRDAHSILGMLVLHDDLFVDTYFFLSGFLLATVLRKFKRLPNLFVLILKRYIRLSVAFGVVIFYICAIFPYTGSGPLWNRAVAGDTEQCRKNWWLSLLMLNNYIDSENICLVVSWYIPCDFHFFLVTVFVYWIYKHSPKIGLTCASLLFIGSVITPGVIHYINELEPVQLFTYEFVSDIRGNEQFQLTYIKSHTRFSAYIVGFFSGYAFIHFRSSGNTKKISQIWSVLGLCAALAVMMIIMVGGVTFLWREYNPIEGALYASLNRPIWACGLSLLFFCCAFGRVPLVESFLSWFPWVPLSRLAYGLYLTHTIIEARNVFVARNPLHYDALNTINAGTGVIIWGCISSLLIWLLAEAPANNLLQLSFKSKSKVEKTEITQGTSASSTTVASSSGNLQDNLPSVVCFSKM